MTGRDSRHRLDDRLTNGVGLSVLPALNELEKAEFAFIRDAVEISDSELSKQVAGLEAAGYVRVEMGAGACAVRRSGCRSPGWRVRDQAHLTALRGIAGQDMPAPTSAAAERVALDNTTPVAPPDALDTLTRG
jgi:hypothetical protein